MKKLFLSLGLAMLSVSCKDQYQTCGSSSLNLYTYGYDSSRIDSIVISRYKKGSVFANKISDTMIVYDSNLYSSYSPDTFMLRIAIWPLYREQYENFDWRYTVLSDGNHVDVTKAIRKFNKTSINHPEPACNSPIVEATINGKVVKDEYGIKAIYLIKP